MVLGSKHSEETKKKLKATRANQTNVCNRYTKGGKKSPGKNVECICLLCGKEFYLYPSSVANGEGKYCSSECSNNSPERLKKLSDAKKSNPVRYWLGKKRNPNTDVNYNDRYMTSEWKEKRKEIYARDNWTCQECGKATSRKFGKDRISCHHIDYNHKNLDNNNLITLCWSCHAKTNGNRPFWTARFSTGR